MKYIEKVKITKFRSFGLSETFECSDLNIFSGGNDSGKSNILKALNLFFNNETDLNIRYNSDQDFNKWYRDNNERGERNIEIEITFSKGSYHDVGGINNGFIGRKIFYSNGAIEANFYTISGDEIKNDASNKRANAIINEKIQYVYVPAIRDSEFRKNVQRKIQAIAESTDKRSKNSALKSSLHQVESGINKELHELSQYVKTLMGIDVEPGVNFATLLESMSFETTEKITIRKRTSKKYEKQKVALSNRGEGIQMQFFAFLLWYISKKDKKHFYIWGYEEPEIAFELKRQFEVYDLYKSSFSIDSQIFITSHSPAFALSEPDTRTNVYRVSYEKDKGIKYLSKIYKLEDYYTGILEKANSSDANRKELERDIWGINLQKISNLFGHQLDGLIKYRHITSQELEGLKNLLNEQLVLNKKLDEEKKKIEGSLNGLYPQKVFICEDENSIDLWGHLLSLIQLKDIDIFASKGCANDNIENILLHKMKEKPGYLPKVFRELDRDGFQDKQVEKLEELKNNKFKKFKKYQVKFLPVCEIENFALLGNPNFTVKLNVDNIFDLLNNFHATAKSNIDSALKLCTTQEEKDIFNNKASKMAKEAKSNYYKYFPGKDIAKLQINFNPTREIKSKTLEELPKEIIDYLEIVKEFFK